jgi:hypothetical protein
VGFGLEHRQEISDLVDIADLNLLSFAQARDGIEAALGSDDPMKNYWGWIVCSSFGKEADPFFETALKHLEHDHLLVRTRAAEFLGLSGLADPTEVISESLYLTEDGIEAALIMNSLVLLMECPFAYEFELEPDQLAPALLEENLVQRRLEYIIK